MKTFKQYSNMALFSALFMMTFFMGGCGGSSSCEDTSRQTIDVTPPIITSTVPTDGAVNVPLNTEISATFSEEINPGTVNEGTFTVIDANGEPVLGTVGYSDNNTVMIFSPNPDNSLDYNTRYTATITTDVTDMDGNTLDITNNLNVWSFTTINEADVIPPTANTAPIVISTIPADGAINVPLNRTVSALLSKALEVSTVNQTTFTLRYTTSNIEVNGTVRYNLDRTIYFDPTNDLDSDTNYTATITNGVTDTDGNTLDTTNGLNEWTFRTGTVTAEGPDPINLGTAGNFVILTKSGITNVPTSAITGNIGSSPITAAAIGVTCSEMVTGFSIHGVDAAYTGDISCFVAYSALVNAAVLDMGTAYTDAAGRTTPAPIALASNISGQTLAPGLYKTATSVMIDTDAMVTLDGGADDVWLFQIEGDLTVMSGASVNLINGAQAKNIFWQVAGSNTTIGTGAQFKGIVLGLNLIAVQTGASVDGRLLSQKNVTLQKNRITQPAP